jgi:hypothetical protein
LSADVAGHGWFMLCSLSELSVDSDGLKREKKKY